MTTTSRAPTSRLRPAFAVMALAVLALATAGSAETDALDACAHKTTGALRLADDDGCRNTEGALVLGSGGAGPQGPPGPAGPAGFHGADGADGVDGADGLSCWDLDGDGVASPGEDSTGDGLVNAMDCQGPMGPQGPTGTQGPAGAAGATGAQGPAGPTGATGPQGPQGIQGPPGPAGPAGPAGGGITKAGLYWVLQTFPVPIGANGGGVAYCSDSNDVIVSGGYSFSHDAMQARSSYANVFEPTHGWAASGTVDGGGAGQITVIAVCLTVA